MKLFSIFLLLFVGTAVNAQTVAIEASDCGTTMSTFTEKFRSNGFFNPAEYEFEFTETTTGAVTTNIRTYHTNTLAWAGLNTLGASYSVRVRGRANGSATFGPYGSACIINAPTTQPASGLVNCVSTPSQPAALAAWNTKIYATPVFGATEYRFEFTHTTTGAVTLAENTTKSIQLSAAGLFEANAIYSVKVAAKVGGTYGPYAATGCLVKAPAFLPTTQLEANSCNVQLNNYVSPIKAINIPYATEYVFEFTDQNSGVVVEAPSPTRQITLTQAGISTPFAAFDVRVKARLGNAVPAIYTAYTATNCDVFTPTVIPLIKLDVASCGLQATLADYSDAITCETVQGATSYRFIFNDITNGLPLDSITVVGTNATSLLELLTVSDTLPNTTYEVRVKAEIGGNFGLYGPTCLVYSRETIPTPNLNFASCGATLTSFGETFRSIVVAGATEYTFKFTNLTNTGAPVQEIVSASHIGKLSTFGLLDASTTYDVEVKAKVNGSYGAYGDVCQLTSPAIPSPTFTSCGVTLSTFGTDFTATTVGGASSYEFRLIHTTTGAITLYEGWHTISLSDMGLYEVGASYNVDVRAKVNGVFGAYGTPCVLNAPATVPTTEIQASFCGTQMSAWGANFYTIVVAGATEYMWEFTNGGTTAVTDTVSTFHGMSFTYANIADMNTAFSIRVKAKVDGQWGAYSTACVITTPGSTPPASPVVDTDDVLNASMNEATTTSNTVNTDNLSENRNGSEATPYVNIANNGTLSVYPNPTSDIVTIATNLDSYKVSIYSATGQLVYDTNAMNSIHKVILDGYAGGMYIVHVSDNSGNVLKTEKLFVTK